MKEGRLLLFNLRTDADDHILGFTTRWINALAPHYAGIDVITMHAGRIATAPNVRVYSLGRERGYGPLQRVLSFYFILIGLLLRHRYVAAFAHMTPLFAAMAGPLLWLFRVRTMLWYTHRQVSRQLRLGLRASWRVVTAVPSSFPLPTPKLRPLGHGIDMQAYMRQPMPAEDAPPCVLHVARLTAIKHQHTLLQAMQDLPGEIIFVGDIPDGYDDTYKLSLFALVETLGMNEHVSFAGALSPEAIQPLYQQATLAVNLSPPGLFDKAALEGMACGLPVIVSNPAFAPVLGPWTDLLTISSPDDVAGLRERIAHLFSLSAAERHAIGDSLHAGVKARHSLDALTRALISVLETGELPADS